ncbi:Syntaxin-binding protein 1 [Rhynchospora pubera]|uniref:Syntaxin-binding protein 1 n=1 Tax=Rhynchospora pubera TaxID=906938 RepID=A0AAV8FDZ2_9POAL|nr:Syntaxin-binding protein 1 [Rhynchospora pubera]
MSISDSDSSSHVGESKTFRQITRDRLLYEMLRSTKTKESKSTWKVLIMDKVTVKIMSYACKMADITEEGVSLVEDLYKRRQPLPSMDAIYFIQPTRENIVMFMSDMSGRSPLYKKAFVFFSSSAQKELVAPIRRDASVMGRLSALSEMNLEYFAIDSQGFVTDHERALEELFGENAEMSQNYNTCINTMATRIATVFASLREFPYVRYRAAKTIDASTLMTLRDLIPTKLAAAVWNCLSRHKSSIADFPQTETCELLIIDRSIDQIAPIIHEWTYDAMCHDLLLMDGNKYVHEVPGKNGSSTEKKEVLLEEHDPVWLELRHAHIGEASEKLHDKMTNFMSKNKAAQIHGRGGGELSTRDLQKIVQALPQYSDQIDKLSLHVEIAGKINNMIREQQLRDIGNLEQDLVFGKAGTTELINFFRTNHNTSRENKLRILMIYAALYPEKFESDKGNKLMQLAGISDDDMIAVNNMRCLMAAQDTKKSSSGFKKLTFEMHKKKPTIREEKEGEEQKKWTQFRFYPIMEDLLEKLSKGNLPREEYPCMNNPSPSFHSTPVSTPQRTTNSAPHVPAVSVRSRRGGGGTWARPRNSDDGYSSDSVLRHASSDFRKMGQRIFVFIIGGATRSELRVVHKLSSKLQREIILGSSSLDDPHTFITKIKMLSQDISLEDLQI